MLKKSNLSSLALLVISLAAGTAAADNGNTRGGGDVFECYEDGVKHVYLADTYDYFSPKGRLHDQYASDIERMQGLADATLLGAAVVTLKLSSDEQSKAVEDFIKFVPIKRVCERGGTQDPTCKIPDLKDDKIHNVPDECRDAAGKKKGGLKLQLAEQVLAVAPDRASARSEADYVARLREYGRVLSESPFSETEVFDLARAPRTVGWLRVDQSLHNQLEYRAERAAFKLHEGYILYRMREELEAARLGQKYAESFNSKKTRERVRLLMMRLMDNVTELLNPPYDTSAGAVLYSFLKLMGMKQWVRIGVLTDGLEIAPPARMDLAVASAWLAALTHPPRIDSGASSEGDVETYDYLVALDAGGSALSVRVRCDRAAGACSLASIRAGSGIELLTRRLPPVARKASPTAPASS